MCSTTQLIRPGLLSSHVCRWTLLLLVEQQHTAQGGAESEARQRGTHAVQLGPALQQAARLLVLSGLLGVLLIGRRGQVGGQCLCIGVCGWVSAVCGSER